MGTAIGIWRAHIYCFVTVGIFRDGTKHSKTVGTGTGSFGTFSGAFLLRGGCSKYRFGVSMVYTVMANFPYMYSVLSFNMFVITSFGSNVKDQAELYI